MPAPPSPARSAPASSAASSAHRRACIDECINLQLALEGERTRAPSSPSRRGDGGRQPLALPLPPATRSLATRALALAEINAKISQTRGENNALERENEVLSDYLDTLMSSVASMGPLITEAKSSPGLRGRLGLGGRRRSVKVNERIGEVRDDGPPSPTDRAPRTTRAPRGPECARRSRESQPTPPPRAPALAVALLGAPRLRLRRPAGARLVLGRDPAAPDGGHLAPALQPEPGRAAAADAGANRRLAGPTAAPAAPAKSLTLGPGAGPGR